MAQTFEIEVNCESGGKPHTHTIVVKSDTVIHGSSKPSRVRLQYTCPTTGEALIATFEPPVGAGKPLTVTQVK
jgi:hypothetical protein